MFRLYFRTFTGRNRAPATVRQQIREQPNTILVPLIILAVFAAFGWVLSPPDMYGGAVGIEESHSLHYFLQPLVASATHAASHQLEIVLALIALGAAGIGAGIAYYLYYARTDRIALLVERLRPIYDLLWNKYWVDEIYHAAIVRPLVRVSDAFLYRVVDARWIDGIGVNGLARVVVDSADRGLKFLQTGLTQSYIFVMLVGGVILVAWLVRGL
jgi:NADH-quinone oxidoreductase subunit L